MVKIYCVLVYYLSLVFDSCLFLIFLLFIKIFLSIMTYLIVLLAQSPTAFLILC